MILLRVNLVQPETVKLNEMYNKDSKKFFCAVNFSSIATTMQSETRMSRLEVNFKAGKKALGLRNKFRG